MKYRILTVALAALLLASEVSAQNAGKPFFRNITATEYRGHNRNFAVECDNQGRVYVANFEGLVIYNGALWQIIHTPGISRITEVHIASDGRVWFGGDNLIGYLPSPDATQAEYVVSDLSRDAHFGEISSIYENGGEIRFTAGEAEYAVRDAQIVEIGKIAVDENARQEYTCVEEAPDLALTIYAVAGEGITVKTSDGGVLFTLNADDGLCSNTVNSLSYDGNGSVWGATDNGVFVVNLLHVYSLYTKTEGLDGQVTSILKSGDALYVGTLQGLFVLDAEDRFKPVEQVRLACWQLVPTADDKGLLAATAQGVFLIEGGSVRQLTERHTLSLFVDGNSSFLTGELDCIYRNGFDGQGRRLADIQNVARFTEDQSGIRAHTLGREIYLLKKGSEEFTDLQDSTGVSLLFEFTDENGERWHSDSQNMGLYNDSLSESQSMWFKPFSDYNIQAMERSGDEMWLGGNFGLIRVDINRMRSLKPYPSEVIIRSFQNDNNFTIFEFSSNKAELVGADQYSYRLNDNAAWSRWSDEKTVEFSHLSPGKYQFTVRSLDAYGQLSQSEPVAFSIPVPFYAKWYALLFYVAVLAGIITSIFRMRIERARQEQLRLEQLVNERTQELKDAQGQLLRQEREATVGKLTKGLIDRILNPLNYINNFSHMTVGLLGDLKDTIEDEKDAMSEDGYDDSVDVVEMMETNISKIEQHGISTTRILKAMEELLKDRSTAVSSVDLISLLHNSYDVTNKYFEKEIAERKIKFELALPGYDVSVQAVAERLHTAFLSMLANSFYAVKKKAEKGGAAYEPLVRLSLSGGNGSPVKVSIYDNGLGIEESIMDKIFDPFFTTKPTAEAPGVGLYLCQQTIQDFEGTISVTSKKDEFTEFTVNLTK